MSQNTELHEEYGTKVTYPENLQWQAVGPLDEQGRGVFVALQHGAIDSKGPTFFLMKYSAGLRAPIHTHTHDYYAVIVAGKFKHYLKSDDEYNVLTPGATWFQKGGVPHGDCAVGDEECIIANFWPEGFDVQFC